MRKYQKRINNIFLLLAVLLMFRFAWAQDPDDPIPDPVLKNLPDTNLQECFVIQGIKDRKDDTLGLGPVESNESHYFIRNREIKHAGALPIPNKKIDTQTLYFIRYRNLPVNSGIMTR